MGAVENLWDVDDVARYLKIKPGTVYKKANAGELPRRKIGGALRFVPSEIVAYVDKQQLERAMARAPLQTPFQNARARMRSLTTESTEKPLLSLLKAERE